MILDFTVRAVEVDFTYFVMTGSTEDDRNSF